MPPPRRSLPPVRPPTARAPRPLQRRRPPVQPILPPLTPPSPAAALPLPAARADPPSLNDTLRAARRLDKLLVAIAVAQLVRRLSARTRRRGAVVVTALFCAQRWSRALGAAALFRRSSVAALGLAALQLVLVEDRERAAPPGYGALESATGVALLAGALHDDAVRVRAACAPFPRDARLCRALTPRLHLHAHTRPQGSLG